MLKVRQLFLKNIGPFSGETFDFSVQADNPDIHIFTGPNGCGKTTILHAIASEFDYFENNHKEHRSNLFYKRFHYFQEDEKGMAKSYAHAIISEKSTNNVIEKVACEGCDNCGHLHQIYDKTVANNNSVSKNGNSYSRGYNKSQSELSMYRNSIVAHDISNRKFKFAVFGYSGYRLVSSASDPTPNEKNFNPLHLALEFVKKNDENANITNWILSSYLKALAVEAEGKKELANKYRKAFDCLTESIGELTNSKFTFEIKTNPWKVVTKYHDKEVEFDVLPDGLRSLLSWIGDLLMRLDSIGWENDTIPVNEQHIILLLDEIEVHLHPTWQYQILPLTRKFFPNAQIFISTHSPFILNSIDNAKIHKLKIDENGNSKLDKTILTNLTNTGDSYSYIYEHVLEAKNLFGFETMKDLERFNEIDSEIVKSNFVNEDEFKEIINRLITEGEEVTSFIGSKLYRLKRVIGKDYLNGENN
jgi:predicted ATP-binding protein involved in virulence